MYNLIKKLFLVDNLLLKSHFFIYNSFTEFKMTGKGPGGIFLNYEHKVLHIISHTDLDGITSAALAWHYNYGRYPLKVTLTGYGSVDNIVQESIQKEEPFMILDLFCQYDRTIDEIDRLFQDGDHPLIFDHHESNFSKYSNRNWLKLDTSCCAAMVYFNWLMENAEDPADISRLNRLRKITEIANDRDLWINSLPESRLWHALVTICGPWSVFSRLVADPSGTLNPHEMDIASTFIENQEKRFLKAVESIKGNGKDISFIGDGILEFGDVSDFGGLVLDRMDSPPLLIAMASRRLRGDWAVSLRSRNGMAGKVSGILQDGKKVRGGGHENAAALYFPASWSENRIRESLETAVHTLKEQDKPMGATLGDLFRNAMNEEK